MRIYRQIEEIEVGILHKLEAANYPEDEAASLDMFKYRITEAKDLTLGYFADGTLLGFVCGTRYHGDTMTHESMNMHIPSGCSVCIHSVVVDNPHRRKGIALGMLDSYIKMVQDEQKLAERILLISKSNLIPLYTRAGFVLRGKSQIVHGADPWYELEYALDAR